jgi:hypothetical protein
MDRAARGFEKWRADDVLAEKVVVVIVKPGEIKIESRREQPPVT